jgi:hypothetical protein
VNLYNFWEFINFWNINVQLWDTKTLKNCLIFFKCQTSHDVTQVTQMFELWPIAYTSLCPMISNLGPTLLHTANDDQFVFFFSLHSHMFYNSSIVFMLVPSIFWVNINTMGVKRHILICVLMSFLVGRKVSRKEGNFSRKKVK